MLVVLVMLVLMVMMSMMETVYTTRLEGPWRKEYPSSRMVQDEILTDLTKV